VIKDSGCPTVTGSGDIRQIRVVISDDVSEMREILRDTLGEDPTIAIVGEADDGRDCIRLVRELEPDVVLLDLAMPGIDGLEAIPLIIKNAPRTGIIVISAFAEGRMGDVARSLGADQYIEKGTALIDVVAAVRAVAESRRGGP
jgi:DNA-binding NarL/FixJ family response regulator